jgi:uncharacterized iron-regulated protein
MRRSTRLLVPILVAASILFLVWQWRADKVMRVADGRIISMDEMIEEVEGVRLICIGENHDRMENHRVELKIIKKIHQKGVPLAIGLEMFTSGNQGVLERWVAGKIGLDDFIKSYYREWSMPWVLYRDIFLYAKKHAIPLVGLNVPRAISRRVAREGFAALTPAELRELPTGVSCSVDPVYRAFIRRAYAAHDGNNESFEHFCEAQMLWNMSMSKYLLAYNESHPATTVVVLAGVGHVMKRGIPAEVSQHSGVTCRVILPELPHLDRTRVTVKDADFLVLTGY